MAPRSPKETVVPRGLKKGTKKAAPYKQPAAGAQVRAHAIYIESGRTMKPAAIARQLKAEGHGHFHSQQISGWRDRQGWNDNGVEGALTAVQRSILRKQPDDLQRVEDASNALAEVSARLARHIAEQIPKMEIKTMVDLEIATRCGTDLLKVHLMISKGLQDLRLVRVSSNFQDEANGAKNGEIIPPEKPAAPGATELDRAVEAFS